MKRLLVATGNPGKARELEELLSGENVKLETLSTHPEVAAIEETGETFDENARAKASQAARASGLWAVADDSGLEVDALRGAPGVRSARFAGSQGDAVANNAKLVRELQGRTDRSARFVCVIALARPNGEVVSSVRGVCKGRVIDEARGSRGFGYDPHFVPEGLDRTMAELEPAEKALISHRGRAVRAFLTPLRQHLLQETN